MKQPVLALADCNNFFVSCERIFRPDLAHKPVVVLSSNDGCAVARSNEAKALGIPMGAPVFKYRQLFRDHQVVQFSANFELYGDISQRIVSLLTSITPRIEVYSVDESFLDLSELDIRDYAAWGREVRALILRNIGVPVSIGIAPSKTLCKLAADRVKKLPKLRGALDIMQAGPERDRYLADTPVHDIWGVGWRLTPKLRAEGVHTALDLRQFRPSQAGQLMGVHGRQMVAELNGTSCIPLERVGKPQQMINRGRQFGEDTNQFSVIEAAIASLTARAAAHLRREGQVARSATLTLRTNRHKPGYRADTKSVSFMTPTADTGTLCAALIASAEQAFSSHQYYHKADITLYDLSPASALQTDIFGAVDIAGADKAASRMAAIDTLNARFGKGHLIYAAEQLSQSWHPHHRLGSPRYTSSWDELPEAYVV
jgi:DNA polymerase V